MQDGGQDAFQKPPHTNSTFSPSSGDDVNTRRVCRMNLTVRVDAVERRRRDDGHFTLTQGTLGGQLLLTA